MTTPRGDAYDRRSYLADERSPEQIEGDIEHTRAELSETLDAIERRLSPSQLIDQAADLFYSGPGEFGSNLARQIRENPIPVALVGIGLVWLMLASQRQRRPAATGRFRLRDREYDDPYRSYDDSDEPWVGGGAYAGRPYATEGYDRYEEDEEPYYGRASSYAVDEEEDEGAWARRRAGLHHDEPMPGGVRREDDPLLAARVDPLSSAAGAPPSAAGAATTEEPRRPSTATTTTHTTTRTEERL